MITIILGHIGVPNDTIFEFNSNIDTVSHSFSKIIQQKLYMY